MAISLTNTATKFSNILISKFLISIIYNIYTDMSYYISIMQNATLTVNAKGELNETKIHKATVIPHRYNSHRHWHIPVNRGIG